MKTPTELVIYWDLSAASILWLLGQVWISMSWLSFTAGGYDNSVYRPQWLRQLLYNRITQLPTEIILIDIKWPWVTRLSWLSPFLEAQLPHRTLRVNLLPPWLPATHWSTPSIPAHGLSCSRKIDDRNYSFYCFEGSER